MHTFAKTAATAVALTLGATSVSAEGKIVIYHWFEYIPQELLDKFTSETGIEVTMDTYDSNEAMLASLKAGGHGHLRRRGSRRLHGVDHDRRRDAGRDRRRRTQEQGQHCAGMGRSKL